MAEEKSLEEQAEKAHNTLMKETHNSHKKFQELYKDHGAASNKADKAYLDALGDTNPVGIKHEKAIDVLTKAAEAYKKEIGLAHPELKDYQQGAIATEVRNHIIAYGNDRYHTQDFETIMKKIQEDGNLHQVKESMKNQLKIKNTKDYITHLVHKHVLDKGNDFKAAYASHLVDKVEHFKHENKKTLPARLDEELGNYVLEEHGR